MLVGIDLGYGFVKVVSGEKTITFPSLVEVGQPVRDGFRTADYEVTIDGKTYYVGEMARREGKSLINLADPAAKEEDLRVLWLTALALVAGDEPLQVVTGLPLNQYDTREVMTKKWLSFQGDVTINGKKRCINAESVQVIPQAMGAMMAGLLEPETMALRNPQWMEQGGYLLLIDIGTRTTGVVTFETQPEFTWVSSLSGATDIGMIDVFRALQAAFRQQTGSAPRLEEIPFWENLLRKGETWYGGDVIDFRHTQQAILQQFGERVTQYAIQLLGGEAWQRVAVTFLAGGGAETPKASLQDRGVPTLCIPDAQKANATGYYLFGRSRA